MDGTTAGIRRTLRESIRFQRDSVSLGAGIRSSIALGTVLALGLHAFGTTAGVTMGAGALVVGLGGRAAGLRSPALTMTFIALAMTLSTFAGSVTGSTVWLHFILLAGWGFGAGLMSAVSTGAAVIGLQAVVGLIVFGRFPESAGGAARLAGFVLAGGMAQVLAAAVVHLPPALGRQRRAVAGAYRLLAASAGGGPDASTLPAAAALDEAEATLAFPGLFGRTDVAALRGLIDEGRRIRVSLAGLARLGGQDEVRATTEAALSAVAEALRSGTDLLSAPLARLTEAEERYARSTTSPRPVLSALSGQIRAAVTMTREAAGLHVALSAFPARPDRSRSEPPAVRVRHQLNRFRSSAAASADGLRANLTLHSPAGRHAVRMAVVVPGSYLLAEHLPLQRGYWIAVTAAVVLKADFATTFTRGIGRTLGTALGAALAGLIAAGFHPGRDATLIIIVGLGTAAFSVFQAGYAAGIGFITALVVFLLDLVTPDSFGTAADRLIDTLVGGALALAAYALWPTWSEDAVRTALAQLVDELRAYVGLVLNPDSQYPAVREAARCARLARTQAEAAVERLMAEPARHQGDPSQLRAVMAGLRRVVQAAHLIRSGDTSGIPPELAAAVDEAMTGLVGTLRAGNGLGGGGLPAPGRAAGPAPAAGAGPAAEAGPAPAAETGLPPLRAIQEHIDRLDPAWEGTDQLVDAINTVGAVLAGG